MVCQSYCRFIQLKYGCDYLIRINLSDSIFKTYNEYKTNLLYLNLFFIFQQFFFSSIFGYYFLLYFISLIFFKFQINLNFKRKMSYKFLFIVRNYFFFHMKFIR